MQIVEELQEHGYRLRQTVRLALLGKDSTQRSIGSLVQENSKRYPDHVAVMDDRQTLTWREFNAAANQVAHALTTLGIGQGDVVAISLQNRVEYLTHIVGIVKLGACAALINTSQRGHILASSFDVVQPKLLLVGEEQVDSIQEIKKDLRCKEAIWWLVDAGKSKCPAWASDFDALRTSQISADLSLTATLPQSLAAFYVFTSGTTGLPKAAIMSHQRWMKAAAGFGLAGLRMTPEDRIYVALPFYHNNAVSVSFGSSVVSGGGIAIRRKFSASQFWQDIAKYQCTAFTYIGELCRYLLLQPAKSTDANNTVKKIMGNGLRPDIWMEFKQRFGIERVVEFYAASESNSGFMNLANKDKTVGFSPSPYKLVRYNIEEDCIVRDKKGFALEAKKGEPGLLVTKITNRWKLDGYTDSKATEKKILRNLFKKNDNWFNSGDLLRVIDHGRWPPIPHLQFVDRIGDTFRWKGENVSTSEVEEVLHGFDGVQECTVYGVQIPHTDGRAGMVVLVVDDPQAFDWQKLGRYAQDNLPPYAIPIFVRLQVAIETTGTFKHRKVALRKEGFDVATIKDPLYYWHNKSYTPLTTEAQKEIESGAVSV